MTCFRSAVCPLLLMAAVIVVAAGNRCRLEPDTGPCRAAIRQFYYNWNDQQCQEFFYGGCRGNANRFDTLAECEQRCVEVCQQRKQVGLCRAAVQRWFYNRRTRKCEPFIYGGCGGNANRFDTLAECRQRCPAVDVCQQPKQVGPCRAAFRRWFYNRKTRSCEPFIYGGCGGNRNNFQSLQECQDQCVPN